jgi:lycopene beta-cyclase
MNNNQSYDYIIAGAGASGLSLLYTLINTENCFADKQILVVDSTFTPKANKTWCFWDENHPFMPLTHKSWRHLTVASDGLEFHEKLANLNYHCIKSEDYQNHVLEIANSAPNVHLLKSNINAFDTLDHRGLVLTDKGTYSADWIFQSVLKPPGFQHSVVDTSLIQHFAGWEIQTDTSCFEPDTALLMDFDTQQNGGLTFFYLLPFTENRALVEYTIFSGQILEKYQYESAIENYLQKKMNLGKHDYRVIRKESGAIPMEDRRSPGYYNERVLNLGIVGGVTKPTTGYTFTRSHAHSKEISDRLQRGKDPVPYSGSSYRFRVYDIMLLYLLEHEADHSRKIFHNLFKYNRIGKILRFLDEKTTFTEELEIFSTLPYAPFFRAIYHMKHRIFTGA